MQHVSPGRSIAIFDRFHRGSSWGILGIDSPRLSSPDRLRLDQLNRNTNWLLPIHLGARIASAGILGIQIKRCYLDRRSASTHPNVSLILLALSATSG